MHITNKATTEVQIMCLVSYTETCAARDKIDRDVAKVDDNIFCIMNCFRENWFNHCLTPEMERRIKRLESEAKSIAMF
jgi:hypothetical protein